MGNFIGKVYMVWGVNQVKYVILIVFSFVIYVGGLEFDGDVLFLF